MTIEREDYRAEDPIIDTSVNAATTLPTLVTEGTKINEDGVKGCRYLNITGTVRNAADDDEGAASLKAWPTFYMRSGACWRQAAYITFSLRSEILADTTGLKSESFKIDKPQGATRFFLHVPSAAAGSVLHYEVERDT